MPQYVCPDCYQPVTPRRPRQDGRCWSCRAVLVWARVQRKAERDQLQIVRRAR